MLLASTSDIIRVVTAQAVSSILAQAAYVDYSGSTVTPGRKNTAITTVATTTVVASPASVTYRNVRLLSIVNNSTSSCTITIQHYDGATSIDIEKIALQAGESFVMAEDGEWRHLTAYGAEYDSSGPLLPNLGIAGTLAEAYPRQLCPESSLASPISGSSCLVPVYLKAGQIISNVSFFSSTTAAGTPTNQLFGLYDRRGQLLAQTTNDTTTAWAANTIKTLALTAPVTIPVSDLYYIAFMVTASTMPTLKSVAGAAQQLSAGVPALRGNSAAGLTTTLPNPTGLPAGASSLYWAAVS